MNFLDILNATSSQELVFGPMPSNNQGGPMTEKCGRAVVRVNLSARQAEEEDKMTSGIYGPTGTISSASASLTQSLVNKLQVRTGLLGSTLYKLTWKPWNTPAGRSLFLLRASGLRRSECAHTGWPTPKTNDFKASESRETVLRRGRSYPTGLKDTAHICGWPTPLHADGRGSAGRGKKELPNIAKMAIPRSQDFGPNPIGPIAPTEKPGHLNPDHSRWLQAIPEEWKNCAAMAMHSMRNKR